MAVNPAEAERTRAAARASPAPDPWDEAARARAQLVEAIEAISEGFVLYDADDRLVLCNSRYRNEYSFVPDMLAPGTRFEEIIREGARRGFVPAGYDPERWVQERLARHRSPAAPYLVQRRDGRWVRMTEYRTDEGGIVGIRTDVTDLFERERSLDENRRLLRAVIDAVPAVINVKDRESRYVLMNRFQGEIYGVDPEAAVGQTSSNFTGPNYGAQSRALDRVVIETGEAVPFSERDFVDVHGDRHTWFTAKLPLKDATEAVTGVVTVALDITELKRTERARANLARYFAPGVAEMLAEADEPFGPARSQTAAVLFVDIVGFTRLCEQLPPVRVFGLLREFQSRMAAAVFACDGTIDKYIGDGMMATFGTPEAKPGDAARALRCAREMLDRVEDWNRSRPAEPPVRIAVGLHYGSVLAGTIGSERRLEFAVIGDTVNVASRLERLARPLQARIVTSEETVAAARSHPAAAALLAGFVPRGPEQVPGRDKKLRLWLLPREEADR